MKLPEASKQVRPIDLASLGTGILRSRELEARGLTRKRIMQMRERGELEHLGRGLYQLPKAPITHNHTLAQVAVRVPHGVICLLSALQFHHLTTQDPWQVWLLLEKGARTPMVDYPPLRTFRASGEAFTAGVEEYITEGVRLRVTCVAKTVVDCFKYRSKVGMAVALEALRECLYEKRADRAALRHYARICRMEHVMAPYIEALSA